MTGVYEAVLFVGGVLLLAITVGVNGLSAWWWSRAVTAVASARVNLVEAREREQPQPEERYTEQSIVDTRGPSSHDDILRAHYIARMNRGDLSTDELAGVPQDLGTGGGAYATVHEEEG